MDSAAAAKHGGCKGLAFNGRARAATRIVSTRRCPLHSARRGILVLLFLPVAAATSRAQSADIPLSNWTEIAGYRPVTRNVTFTPEALERTGGPAALPETTRSLLVGNGTLNSDGTYNLATARARGWEIPEKPIPFAP